MKKNAEHSSHPGDKRRTHFLGTEMDLGRVKEWESGPRRNWARTDLQRVRVESWTVQVHPPPSFIWNQFEIAQYIRHSTSQRTVHKMGVHVARAIWLRMGTWRWMRCDPRERRLFPLVPECSTDSKHSMMSCYCCDRQHEQGHSFCCVRSFILDDNKRSRNIWL